MTGIIGQNQNLENVPAVFSCSKKSKLRIGQHLEHPNKLKALWWNLEFAATQSEGNCIEK